MKKSTKIMLGVGALAVVGYFIYKNNQDKKTSTGQQNAGGKTDYRCPKGYTFNNGYCMPNDITKTVIKANI